MRLLGEIGEHEEPPDVDLIETQDRQALALAEATALEAGTARGHADTLPGSHALGHLWRLQ